MAFIHLFGAGLITQVRLGWNKVANKEEEKVKKKAPVSQQEWKTSDQSIEGPQPRAEDKSNVAVLKLHWGFN